MSIREQHAASRWSQCWAGLLLLIASATASADAIHEGVASCAGGTCHAATVPFGESGIRGDEYFIWQTQDVHGKAFATLGSERSQKMGQKLGINQAAVSRRRKRAQFDLLVDLDVHFRKKIKNINP